MVIEAPKHKMRRLAPFATERVASCRFPVTVNVSFSPTVGSAVALIVVSIGVGTGASGTIETIRNVAILISWLSVVFVRAKSANASWVVSLTFHSITVCNR